MMCEMHTALEMAQRLEANGHFYENMRLQHAAANAQTTRRYEVPSET